MTNQSLSSESVASVPSSQVLRYKILGSRRPSNFLWALVTLVGGVGFLLAGLSSYLQRNLLPVGNPVELIFVPQGLAIGFYGVAALLIASYLWMVIALDVGAGFNEFNKESGMVRVFRWGYLGKNRKIEVSCRTEAVQSIRISIQNGINPKRELYLRIKGRGDVPLTRVGQPLPLAEIEDQAAEIARFLGVPMEGL